MSTSRHPKGLYLIFATSTAERFSYYGMRAIFILFLTQALLFDKEHAASIYGSYTGLVYLTPLIGGYIADKYWGIRRSVFWGAMMMAVGQFLMFASASMLEARELSHWLMYGGLTFLILGNGCFKPTVSSLVGQLYEPGDKRLDSAYTIFYMGVNVGSFLAPLVCGYFGETGNPHDFRWGFLIAAIVTVLTVVLFETQKNKYLIGPDGKPLGIIPDARKERPQADNTARKSAHANGRPMRNYLLLALLAIALAGFFYWCFGSDWISIGIFTACITSVPHSPVVNEAQVSIVLDVGPEYVTGSTRMKSGTAQKMVLNMISTTAMIRLGRVDGNKMVHLMLSNEKLIDRGTRIVARSLHIDYDTARQLLLGKGSVAAALKQK